METTGQIEQFEQEPTNLNRIRKQKGFSQVRLASAVGVSQACISQAAHDPQMLSYANWSKVAQLLGVQLSDLLPPGTTFKVYKEVSV